MTIWAAGLLPTVGAAAVALAPGRQSGWLGPLRTLSLVAATIVVFTNLLPEAIEALGVAALAVFAVALVMPSMVERLAPTTEATLHATVLGIALHQLIDGVQIGVLGASVGVGAVWAVGLHGAPLVLATLLPMKQHLGTRATALAAAFLAGSLALGAALGGAVSEAALDTVSPWLAAAASGLLMHILAHDLDEHLPNTQSERVGDLLVVVVGAAVTFRLLSGDGHGPTGVGASLLHLSSFAGPPILLCLAAAALLTKRSLDEIVVAAGPWIGVFMIVIATAVPAVGSGWLWAVPLGAVVARSLARVSLREWLSNLIPHHIEHEHGHHH